MALGIAQPLTEMSTRRSSWGVQYGRRVELTISPHLRSSTACYGGSFTFRYVDDVLPHRKHTYTPPRPVAGIALLFYKYMSSYLIGNTALHGLLLLDM
jgi:hypothetical protein